MCVVLSGCLLRVQERISGTPASTSTAWLAWTRQEEHWAICRSITACKQAAQFVTKAKVDKNWCSTAWFAWLCQLYSSFLLCSLIHFSQVFWLRGCCPQTTKNKPKACQTWAEWATLWMIRVSSKLTFKNSSSLPGFRWVLMLKFPEWNRTVMWRWVTLTSPDDVAHYYAGYKI